MKKKMIGQLVDISLENNKVSLAKIIYSDSEKLKVQYMSPIDKRWKDKRRIYKYEKDEYEIVKENISGYYDTQNEEVIGYKKIENDGFVFCESSESEYEPSESDL